MAGKFANFVPAAESALINALSALSELQKLETELAAFFGEDAGDKENGSIESILAGLHGLYSEIKKCLHKKKLLKLVNSDASQGHGKHYTFVGQVALTNQGTGIVLADRIDGVIEVNLGWSLKQILPILIRFLLFFLPSIIIIPTRLGSGLFKSRLRRSWIGIPRQHQVRKRCDGRLRPEDWYCDCSFV